MGVGFLEIFSCHRTTPNRQSLTTNEDLRLDRVFGQRTSIVLQILIADLSGGDITRGKGLPESRLQELNPLSLKLLHGHRNTMLMVSTQNRDFYPKVYRRKLAMSELLGKQTIRKSGRRESRPIRPRLRNREQEPATRVMVAQNTGRLETRRTPLLLKRQSRSATTLALARQGLAEAPCIEAKDHISTSKVITTLTEEVIYPRISKKVGNIKKTPKIIPSLMAGATSSRRLFGHQGLQKTTLRRLSRIT